MKYNAGIKSMIDLLRRGEGVVKVIEHGRTRTENKAHSRKPPLSLLRRRYAADDAPQAAVPLLAVPALAARRLRDGDASTARRVDTMRRRTSFIAHLSHASRQPQGTASNVTGLPHLQVVTCVEITLSRVHRRERGRAGTVERWNGHLHAVEQASRRWRGGHDPAVAETRRENLIYAQVVLLPAPPSRQLWPSRVGPEGRTA